MSDTLDRWAGELLLGPLLQRISSDGASFDHIAHWQQGEFHHDHVLRLREPFGDVPGRFLVISTNCNAGVKKILCLADAPERWGLWHLRCPDNAEFDGPEPEVREQARTVHWFDPCALLTFDARSELKPEARQRQRGGGWIPLDSDEEPSSRTGG